MFTDDAQEQCEQRPSGRTAPREQSQEEEEKMVLVVIVCLLIGGVVQDNIKDVMLRGKDFDRRAVTHLKLYGCLPIQERKSGGEEGGNYYNERHTRGEIRFESCMSVIR